MFFIVSVGRHDRLSPSVYTASNAPSSETSMVKSTMSCAAGARRTFTSRIRDLPYRFQVDLYENIEDPADAGLRHQASSWRRAGLSRSGEKFF